MNPTTSEPEGGAPPDSPRHTPVIAQEVTTEIPVHLLFRDDDAHQIDLRPAVVARRQGTGEQPKVAARRPAPPRPSPQRPAPPADPDLAERAAPALPGWTGAVAGACSLAGIGALLWGTGALPGRVTALLGLTPYPYHGIGIGVSCVLALGVLLALFALGGLGRVHVGHAWVLTLFGDYGGTVRRTGLVWVSPLVRRRPVDVRLRHWRSHPMPAADADGTALSVVVLVVWRVEDTARAALGVGDHEAYLSEQVEAALARVLSQLPSDGLRQDAPAGSAVGALTLRNAEAVGDTLTRTVAAECVPAGIEVFSAQPTAIEYAPEVAAAIQRRQVVAIDAKNRDAVLTSVVDAVDDTVNRLTARGLIEPDDYERKALVRDLTIAFYTGRSGAAEG